MVIEMVNSSIMKVFVSRKEMAGLKCKDKRNTVKSILKHVFYEIGDELFPKNHTEIVVRVKEDGLGTEFTIFKHDKPYKTDCCPVIYRFKNVSELQNGIVNALFYQIPLIRKSDLFLFSNDYYLVLYPREPMDNSFLRRIYEYSELVGKGPVATSFIEEHGKKICENDALEKLSLQYFDRI